MNENGSSFSSETVVTETSTGETTLLTVTETNNIESGILETTDFANGLEIVTSEINSKIDATEIRSQSSQKLAETAHDETKQNVISEYGHYMSDKQKEILNSDKTKERL